jgi:type IV pilus assembly protein PilA
MPCQPKRRRPRADEGGFTLVEMLIALLILGILVAIAIPSFVGFRSRAQDRAVQTQLRNGLSAARIYYSDGGTYDGFDVSAAEAIEPALHWNTTVPPLATTGFVYIEKATGTELHLVAQSDSGTFFALHDSTAPMGKTTYCSGDTYSHVQTAGQCTDLKW